MLLLSQGTPMLVAGDELGRTQRGNNNAYCQDNEISWIDWPEADQELIDFVSRCIRLRKRHAVLGSDTWLQPADAAWFAPDSTAMTTQRWNDPDQGGLTLILEAESEHLAFVFNESSSAQEFTLPYGGPWTIELSTEETFPTGHVLGATFRVPGSTLLVVSAVSG